MRLTVFAKEASLLEIGKRSRDSWHAPAVKRWHQHCLPKALAEHRRDRQGMSLAPQSPAASLSFFPFLVPAFFFCGWGGIPTLHCLRYATTEQERRQGASVTRYVLIKLSLDQSTHTHEEFTEGVIELRGGAVL